MEKDQKPDEDQEPEKLMLVKQGFQVIEEQSMMEVDAAYALKVSKQTLARIRKRNGIAYRRISKGKILYMVEDILAYLDHVKRKPDWGVSD